ncbi:uncharacterized protein MONBRDRAFT_14509 [Monosiga brevicollis MX1]|uniref:GHMP kinase N-terminal domain-containing protein n=1 Tax=Monosiga brevicollis TaxID=81824 RepID=A9URB3_MONBE|nr:uncharacterized protein MONBRDRAFT_14509 [Monosiga brevicollis MX1]EDQ91895.1 predicted protein [Monosiga brevicollis MX1]|eukprot:XP_001743181.1 hypothetical protein [Monosiga brevicollis MX1]
MKCIILVAGHATRLERELCEQGGTFRHLRNIPKALLPGPDGQALLDQWWKAVSSARQHFSDVFLVTNAAKYKNYERWATARGFPRQNIINDGTTSGTGGIGAVADLRLALRSKRIDEDIMVVSGDMLFHPESFDLDGVIEFFKRNEGDLACYYQLGPDEDPSTRGVLEVDNQHRVTKFVEKPTRAEDRASRLASVVFYCFRQASLQNFECFLKEVEGKHSFGDFMAWHTAREPVYGMKLPDHFDLIGEVGLEEYRRCLVQKRASFDTPVQEATTCRAHARVGLMGNPSDGFNGKTISLSIANYWAEATIEPSARLVLEPHPLNDPNEFGGLADLYTISRREGYQGGLRLMQATCKRFFEYCRDQGIAIARRNFRLRYDTNIPRQVGLAGSSAICTSILQCLMAFYHVTEADIPRPIQPSFVLSVETGELGINAGLQDRVIQAYNGCVYMDFGAEIMKRGHGIYEYLDTSKLPQFWLGYLADPSDSGKIHSDVRQRYDAGETAAVEGMKRFASFAEEAKQAIEEGDHGRLADLMDANFSLRREIYGDACLGEANLRMVSIAKSFNSAVKFPGSGGAVVGLCRDASRLQDLREAFEAEGFVFVILKANEARA